MWPLIIADQLVGIHANYQLFTQFFCLVKEIQVPDVEHVKCSLCISYLVFSHQL